MGLLKIFGQFILRHPGAFSDILAQVFPNIVYFTKYLVCMKYRPYNTTQIFTLDVQILCQPQFFIFSKHKNLSNLNNQIIQTSLFV